MANSQALSTSFKQDLFNGLHAFGASVIRAATTKDSFKGALYLASGSQGAGITAYSSTNELAATGGYSAGGVAVTNATAPTTSGTTAFWTPSAQLQWTGFTSSGSFDAVSIYNDTSAGKNMVGTWTFGAQLITAGTFNLTMPVNDSANALIRLA